MPPQPAADTGASPTATGPDATATSGDDGDAPPEDPPPSHDTPPGPEAVSKRDVDQAALQLAVGEGRIERLGSLYVARAGDDELTWNEAQDRCRGKRINGVQGFRLPGVSELRKIRAARLLGAAIYWARNRGAQPDEAVAYDAQAGTTALYLKLEPNARAVCVRTL